MAIKTCSKRTIKFIKKISILASETASKFATVKQDKLNKNIDKLINNHQNYQIKKNSLQTKLRNL